MENTCIAADAADVTVAQETAADAKAVIAEMVTTVTADAGATKT